MALTVEVPAPGLQIAQPTRGFRYGAEAFWLAGAVATDRPAGRAVELGTGSGIAAALLGRLGWEVLGVELRAEWVAAWSASRFPPTVRMVLADVATVDLPAVDVVLSNPPFFVRGAGPASSDRWKAAARTESTATLAQFVAAAARALNPDGAGFFVVPREREVEVTDVGEGLGLGASAVWRIGARRSVVRLARGPRRQRCTAHDERSDLVRSWYTAVTA